MWRCSILVLLLLTGLVHGQSSHRHPIYEEPSEDERLQALARRNSTIDELLYPLSYYETKDNIFYSIQDSVIAKNKLKRTYFQLEGNGDDLPPVLRYTYYDKSGRLEQEAVVNVDTYDSLVHKWKYDASGYLKTYVTLNFSMPPGQKRKVNGDSIAIKNNSAGKPIEISRYSVTGAGASRSASFISKETFTYNTNNQILTKGIDGYKYTYKYDQANHITRIECKASYDGEMYTIDSFAWRSGYVDDTMFHWALLPKEKIKVLMERRVTNRTSGLEVEYVLFPTDKYNFIRDISGPVRLVSAYDAALHLIRFQHTTVEGELYYEESYLYGVDGIFQGFTSMHLRDPEFDIAPLPPQAKSFTGSIFVATTLSYLSASPGAMPDQIEFKNTLIGMKGETREVLAHGTRIGKMKIVCEYYP